MEKRIREREAALPFGYKCSRLRHEFFLEGGLILIFGLWYPWVLKPDCFGSFLVLHLLSVYMFNIVPGILTIQVKFNCIQVSRFRTEQDFSRTMF